MKSEALQQSTEYLLVEQRTGQLVIASERTCAIAPQKPVGALETLWPRSRQIAAITSVRPAVTACARVYDSKREDSCSFPQDCSDRIVRPLTAAKRMNVGRNVGTAYDPKRPLSAQTVPLPKLPRCDAAADRLKRAILSAVSGTLCRPEMI